MNSTPTAELTRLLTDGKLDEVEERWMAAVEQGDGSVAEFRRTALGLVAAGRPDSVGSLVGCLLENRKDQDIDPELLEFARESLQFAIDDAALRKHVADLHERAGVEDVGALLRTLDGGDTSKARERVAKCLLLRSGAFVDGSERAGPERVASFDVTTLTFKITDGSDEREISIDQAAEEFTALAADDFRGLLRFEPETLKARAQTDPDGLLVSALKSHNGRLEWKNLKKLFARGIVPQNQMSRWWNKSRSLVERNPLIQLYGDKEPILILRTDPISHEEELTGRIARAEAALDKVNLVASYLTSVDEGHELDPAFIENCCETLLQVSEDPATDNPTALLAAAHLAEISERTGAAAGRQPDLETLLTREGGFGETPTILLDEDSARRAFLFLLKHGGEHWPPAYAESLPYSSGRLAETLVKELVEADQNELLSAAVQRILATPDRYGEGLFWLYKATTSGSLDSATFKVDKSAVALALLRLMDRWARSAKSQVTDRMRALLGKMRSGVATGNCKALMKVIGEIKPTQAAPFHIAIKDNQGLTDAARHNLSEELKFRFRDEILGRKLLFEEDTIYVSPAGMKRRQTEFDQIVNVEMVKNSEAIGRAADFGDLSENAEFTSALEQRDFLSRRANEIGDEIKQAEIIPIDSITTDFVNVGTSVVVRSQETGEEETLTFLGPWDADPDNKIFSYKAPYAMSFLGSKVGEVIELEEGETTQKFEIVKISLADVPQ